MLKIAHKYDQRKMSTVARSGSPATLMMQKEEESGKRPGKLVPLRV
jgi:hypothetical protein